MQHQWDEHQYSQLTGQPHPDIERYLQTRHLASPKRELSPYAEPSLSHVDETPEIVKGAEIISRVVGVLVVPAAKVVGIVVGAKFAWGAVTVGVVAAGAGMEAWAIANGGALMAGACVAIAGLVAWVMSLLSGGAASGESKSGGTVINQYNNFGQNPNQNNGTK